jgi:hypothetical protein
MNEAITVRQCANGRTVKTTRFREVGFAISIVAKEGKQLFARAGVICPTAHSTAIPAKRFYVCLRPLGEVKFLGTDLLLDASIGNATLFPKPLSILPSLVEMLMNNTAACSHIEIGNEKNAQKIELPKHTARQQASLKAITRANRTGRPVTI